MCEVTFYLNGGTAGIYAASQEVVVQVPANTKITESDAQIPRPFYFGYTLEDWFVSDEQGNVLLPENEFNFDDFITEDMDAAAKWGRIP